MNVITHGCVISILATTNIPVDMSQLDLNMITKKVSLKYHKWVPVLIKIFIGYKKIPRWKSSGIHMGTMYFL